MACFCAAECCTTGFLAFYGGLTGVVSLFLRGRGKVVYILPSSDSTLALLLVGFTEYDDYDD
ncbi:hypothetical protein Hanom_Chr10g00948071 [Helianthus anomalus]